MPTGKKQGISCNSKAAGHEGQQRKREECKTLPGIWRRQST